jgi:hypothetical protein
MRTTDIEFVAVVILLGLSFISTDAVISGLCVAFSITIETIIFATIERKELSKMENKKS